VDGYCCESACEGECANCALPGQIGICGFTSNVTDPGDECGLCRVCNGAGACKDATFGTDPEAECAQAAETTCGFDGMCDGAGGCRFWAETTACNVQSCTGNVKQPADYCDAAGACKDSGTVDCTPYVCNATGKECLSACTDDANCVAGYFCEGVECAPKKDDGETCQGASECKSDFCVDGYCCDTACDAECESCGEAGSEGSCSSFAAETDPDFECGLCFACNGASACAPHGPGEDFKGECTATDEATCDLDGSCDGTGQCRLWAEGSLCSAPFCTGHVRTPSNECDGTGNCLAAAPEACDPYVCLDGASVCRMDCLSDVHCVDGYYCEGSTCVSKKANGKTCLEGSECASGFCVDGYCCNNECAGVCRSCNDVPGVCTADAINTDEHNDCGLCGVCNGAYDCMNVAGGADPMNECTAFPKESCLLDGACDGAGACRFWSTDSVCLAAYCEGGVSHESAFCDGAGACQAGVTSSCSPYLCKDDGTGCHEFCLTDVECVPTHYCLMNECVPLKGLGEPCAGDSECSSKHCADGVCCDVPCSGVCEACDLIGHVGGCALIVNDTDPEGECGLCGVCNGGGACKDQTEGADVKDECAAQAVETCGHDGSCDGSGACRLWDAGMECAPQSCAASTYTPPRHCDGAGACLDPAGDVDCCPHLCGDTSCLPGCDSDDQCCEGAYCLSGQCAWKKANGKTCTTTKECLSGFCVDGYCCNSDCAGTCSSCGLAGKEGTCASHLPDGDPDGECGTCRVCDGVGGCKNVPDGADLKSDCDQTLPSTCGQDGACNGAAACRYWAAGTVCGEQLCEDAVLFAADLCDGAGSCADGGADTCCPYGCNESLTSCRTGCTSDIHCCDGFYCSSGACVAKKGNGTTCSNAAECSSGFCADGYCCNSLCDSECESCSLVAGTCTPHPASSDPENDCADCFACSGAAGECVVVAAGLDPVNDCPASAAATCKLDGACDGTGGCRQHVAGTMCLDAYCLGWNLFAEDTCDGAGTCADAGFTSCEPYYCEPAGLACAGSCATDDDCMIDYYCDGAACLPKLDLGEPCASDHECASWFCADGICCDSPCAGQCQACDLAGSEGNCTGLPNDTDPEGECPGCSVCSGGGNCKFATKGSDPKNECAPSAQSTCSLDGSCSGFGACAYWGSGIVCAGETCIGTTYYPEDRCSGTGACLDSGGVSCAPYVCDATKCKTSCAVDADCSAGNYCSGAQCTAKKGNGQTCGAGTECVSGFCVDGYCCNSECTGTCRSCSVTGSLGLCTFVAGGSDPAAECGTCKSCNGSGACANAASGTDPKNDCTQTQPSTCGNDGVCDGSGACRKWSGATVCKDAVCSDHTLQKIDHCSGVGACVDSGVQECCPYACDGNECGATCSSDAGCCATHYCLGSQCVVKLDTGATCSSGNQCKSGFCADGYCCNLACTGECESCSQAGAEGSCTSIPTNTDPDFECATCTVCNGAGACTLVPAGADPVDDCAQQAEVTCGMDGACNGAGACRLWAVATECSPAYCFDHTMNPADLCDGDGSCTDSGATDCTPYNCNADGSACLAACAIAADCASGYYCDAGTCKAKKDMGLPCTAPAQCLTGFCTDGVCCNLKCDGACRSCDQAGSIGTCTFMPNTTDPTGECGLCKACNGAGFCQNELGGTDVKNECAAGDASGCGLDGSCNGKGACRKWPGGTVCLAQACAGSTFAGGKSCDGDGNCVGSASDCVSLGWSDLLGSHGICSESKPCSGAVTFDAALAICQGWGGRLCTYSELAARETQGSGCGYEDKPVWTVSECEEDSYFTGPGDPDNIGTVPKTCTDRTSLAYVRCCADALSCCPSKCSGNDCDSVCAADAECCSGSFCDSGKCVAKKVNGSVCATAAECQSGKCVDGYCCDTSCIGACKSCAIPGLLGKCTNHPGNSDPENDCSACMACNGYGACTGVKAGTDPLDDCEQEAPDTCGKEGTCSGAGGCTYWPATTVCHDQECIDHTLYKTDKCNGAGACIDAGAINCCPYVCVGNTCRTDCSVHADCCSGNFCVGNACVPVKPDGLACVAGAECASGQCVDGFCCNTACGETCKACNLAGKVGTCSFIGVNQDPSDECGVCSVCNGSGACAASPAGQDPLNECDAEAPCSQDGACSGVGACRLWPAGTECGAKSCSGGILYAVDTCDGSGVCADGGSTSCAPYVCSGNACSLNCATDNDCVVGYYCSASQCVAKKGLGEVCGANQQCLSGYCVDGVCCDNACTGTCRSCNNAGSVGVCTFALTNTDPQTECGWCQACNGAGACKFVASGQDPKNQCSPSAPSTCGDDGNCDGGGACRKWAATTECTVQSCTGTTLSPTDHCNGTGACTDAAPVSCCPFKCGAGICGTSCNSNADCCADAYCYGSACVTKKANGTACASAGECQSGNCVDGYCCNTACTGTCQACNVSGSPGTCTPETAGTDPMNECLACNQCNGAGTCAPVPVGQDPFGDCTQEAQSTCGQSGSCSGSGGCALWPAATVCVPAACVGSTLTAADTCNGSGVCIDGGTASCCPYACIGDSCGSSCSNNSHCCSTHWCSGATCIPRKADGDTCTAPGECLSGNCVDGVCCDKPCTGPCQACNLPGFVGGCTFVAFNTDPHGDCSTCKACNGAGACANVAAATDPVGDCPQQDTSTCGFDGLCNGSGACRYWPGSTICHAQECADHIFKPTDFCSGGGACLDSGSTDCCPFDCSGDACRTVCEYDPQCCENALCKSTSQCQTCSLANPCDKGQYCCKGDTCGPSIEVHSPAMDNANNGDATYYGSTFGANNDFDYACCSNANGSNAPDRVYHFTTKADYVGVDFTVKVWGNFDSIVYMRQGACGAAGANVAYNDDCPGLGDGSCISLRLLPGQDWYLYVDGMGTDKGDYTIQFDFTSLCGNCTCDSAYGENTSNNPVECWETGDYCGNYINVPIGRPDTKYFYHDLAGDHDDFSHYSNNAGSNMSYAWGSCSDCDWCHDEYDKIYRLEIPPSWSGSTYVSLRMDRNGGWSPGNYPRVFVWKADSCQFNSVPVQGMLCMWGDGPQYGSPTSPKVWPPGIYWIMTDVYYEQSIGAAPYRLWINVWDPANEHQPPSDIQLKDNLSYLPGSPYEAIGLHGARWTWSREAGTLYGKYGADTGVIAQEVEQLYPQAVSRDNNGYLHVDYDLLDALMVHAVMSQ